MTLNIEQDLYGQPLRRDSEYFVLRRKDIEFEVKYDQENKISSPFMKGHLVLTNERLILMNSMSEFESPINSFEIPLTQLKNEKYEKPKLGAYHYRGTVTTVQDDQQVEQDFKIWFLEGSCNKFIDAMLICTQKIQDKTSHQNPYSILRDKFTKNGKVLQNYKDDSSVLYEVQPILGRKQVVDREKSRKRDLTPMSSMSSSRPSLRKSQRKYKQNSILNEVQKYDDIKYRTCDPGLHDHQILKQDELAEPSPKKVHVIKSRFKQQTSSERKRFAKTPSPTFSPQKYEEKKAFQFEVDSNHELDPKMIEWAQAELGKMKKIIQAELRAELKRGLIDDVKEQIQTELVEEMKASIRHEVQKCVQEELYKTKQSNEVGQSINITVDLQANQFDNTAAHYEIKNANNSKPKEGSKYKQLFQQNRMSRTVSRAKIEQQRSTSSVSGHQFQPVESPEAKEYDEKHLIKSSIASVPAFNDTQISKMLEKQSIILEEEDIQEPLEESDMNKRRARRNKKMRRCSAQNNDQDSYSEKETPKSASTNQYRSIFKGKQQKTQTKVQHRFEEDYRKIVNQTYYKKKDASPLEKKKEQQKQQENLQKAKKGIKIYNPLYTAGDSKMSLENTTMMLSSSEFDTHPMLVTERFADRKDKIRLQTFQNQSRLQKFSDVDISPERMQNVREQWRNKVVDNRLDRTSRLTMTESKNTTTMGGGGGGTTQRTTTRQSSKASDRNIDQMTRRNLQRIARKIGQQNHFSSERNSGYGNPQ